MQFIFLPFLLASCREEDLSFLTNAYQTYGLLMHFIARKELDDINEAHDAVLSTFIELIEETEKLRQLSDEDLRCYLVTAVRHNAIDMRRQKKRWEQHCFYTDDDSVFDQICDSSDVEDEILRQASIDQLYQALKLLQKRDKTLLTRKYLENVPDKKIAAELGIAVASMRTYLSRARMRLRIIMEEMDK